MHTTGTILIFGSGHLSYQVQKKLSEKGYSIAHIPSSLFKEEDAEFGFSVPFTKVKDTFEELGIDSAKAVYILDNEDRRNIPCALAAIATNDSVPVFVSLFNEDLAAHFQKTHKNLSILNPARIAAPAFVDALNIPVTRNRDLSSLPVKKLHTSFRPDRWIMGLLFVFSLMFAGSAAFFRLSEELSWLDAFYFTTTIITTTGFGDIHLRDSAAYVKIFGIFLMLAAITLASVTFSLIVDRLVQKRQERALGHKKYRQKNHVVMCGLGRAGYQIFEELRQRGIEVIIIENNAEGKFLDLARASGATIFIGDASLSKNLHGVSITEASALISVINNDLKNLEIGLNARTLKPDLRLILRIFDVNIAEEIKKRLDIHLALSTSAIASDKFVELIEK